MRCSPYLEVMFMDDRTVAQIAPSGDFGNTHHDQLRQPADVGAAARASSAQPANLLDADGLSVNRSPPRHAAARCSSIRSPARPITAAPADPAPQRRRRRPPRRPAAHQLPHRRRHERRAERRLVVRHVLPVRADQLRRDLFERLLGPPPRPRARRHRQSGHGGRRSDLPLGAGRRRAIRAAFPGTSSRSAQVTPAALTYLQTPGLQRGVTQQSVANASITGDLGAWGIKFPWANNGVGIAARRRVSPRDPRAAGRPGLLDAAVVRPCRPGRADASGRRRLRRQGSLRRGPHPDRRGQLLLQPRRSKAAIAIRITASAPARSAPTPTRWRRLRADPRHPLPRHLQPRGPGAEHPGAVRAAAGRPRRQHRSLRGRGDHGRPPTPAASAQGLAVAASTARPAEPGLAV